MIIVETKIVLIKKNSVERCLFDLIVKLVLLLRHKGYWIDLIKRGIRMMTFLITPEFDLDCQEGPPPEKKEEKKLR